MSHSILVVEDEEDIAQTICFSLKKAGMQVQWCASGQEALLAMGDHVDLILLDQGLPDIRGFDLLKQFREHYDTPIIFLTAHSEEIDRIVGLEIGADDYVTKPFSPRELVARINVVLRRVHSASAINKPLSQATSFSLDENLQDAFLNGDALQLTKAEWLMMQLFVTHPGRVYSRRQLIDIVWSENHPSGDRAIDTHIKTLRAKIKKADTSKEYIVTRRGLGYSFEI